MAVFTAELKIGGDGDDEHFFSFSVDADGVTITFPNAIGLGRMVDPPSVTVPIKQFISAMDGFVALLQTIPIEDAENG